MSLVDLTSSEFSKLKCINNQESGLSRSTSSDIVKYSPHELSYQTFLCEHMIENIPCIISSNTYQWPGLKWVEHNKPNFKHLTELYGDTLVPVANCGERYYNAQSKKEQTLKEYLKYWESYINMNYSSKLPCLYLKDWHFTRDFPEENIYKVPEYFSSDWLNEYFTARDDVTDDYRFVYMGPKGSWTPLHADVFSSFSWSINLCGKKRWMLFPPGQEKYLTDKHGNLAYDVESSKLGDSAEFHSFTELETSYEIIQLPGEAIFVPSGWHHQVWNLEDTISVNHNWVNGCNIGIMWRSIRNSLAAVQAEITDCKDMEDWDGHCQLMLNATYGLDYRHFCQFLVYVIRVRLKHLADDLPFSVFGGWLIGENHLKFDLMQAKNVLKELIDDSNFKKLTYYSEIEGETRNLLEQIDTIMDRK